MIVVKNARFVTDNKTIQCTMDYYVLLNGVPENRPRIAISEARCAPDDTFDFKVGMDLAYDRAYAKACETVRKNNNPPMRFVCVKSNSDFKSGVIYSVYYDADGQPYVLDSIGDRRPTLYKHVTMGDFLDFMKGAYMVRLED